MIPVRNGVRWLEDAIRSVQEQTFDSWAGVVVDDGSTDGSLELAARTVRRDERFRVVTQPNAGVAAARNTGLAHLSRATPYVAFLDADDRYEPGALGLLHASLDERADAVGAYVLARYVDAAGAPFLIGRHEAMQGDRRRMLGRRVVTGPADSDVTFDSLVVSNPIWPAAVALLRTPDLLAVGGFDPSFSVQQDWELYLRLSRRGPFVPVSHTLVDYRRHGANATATSREHAHQQSRIRRKAWRSSANTAHQRRTVARAWRWLQLRQVREHGRQLPIALRHRDMRAAGQILLGIALCAVSATLPGPPASTARLSAWMHTLPYHREIWNL